VCEHTFSTEEFARDVEGLSSDDDDLLAVQKLLCNCAGETTEQVSLAVDDNLERPSSQFMCSTASSVHAQAGLRVLALARMRLTTGSKVDILLPVHLAVCRFDTVHKLAWS
jgi:hypothetical protein